MADRAERAARIQRAFEWPVIAAAIATIPILVIQESDLGDGWTTAGDVLSWIAWLIFFLEVAVMLWVTPKRWEWIRAHPIDLAVTVLTPPFAPAAWQAGRLFRLVRLLRLTRLFSLRRLLSLEGMRYAALVAAATIVLGGAVFASIESEQDLSTGDGIWWAVTTVTTVGYGDISPESTAGRIIAAAIMLVGIGFVALLTAFIADRFIAEQAKAEERVEEKEDVILEQLRTISERLDRIEVLTGRGDPTTGPGMRNE